MIYQWSQAILNNIERTYTYSFCKNKFGHQVKAEAFNPFEMFERFLQDEPFKAIMELDGFQFKKALNTLDRYKVPYTPEQERKARVHYEITNLMNYQKSDYVKSRDYTDEDIKDTDVLRIPNTDFLTTKETKELASILRTIPRGIRTGNTIYQTNIPRSLLDSPEQYNALKNCIDYRVSCLIGGAGTGKSFVTSNIVEQLYLNGKTVAILAPTHKAKEALQGKLKRGKAQTIHSFIHKGDYVDAVVVDESGMLSTPLLLSLLKKYRNKQLIFVGDKNQLPPIEYGRPFEYIQNAFMTSEIKKNRRSEAPDIIALGREILGIPQNANMNHDNIVMVNTTEQAFNQGAEVILTFTNKNVGQINEYKRLKKGASSISPNFKIGERIVAKTNTPEKGYYNGQIYEVTGYKTIRNMETGKIITLDTARDLEFNFTYAYGLTVHKSQGSEWDIVAYQPSEQDYQSIAYVAVTRAKKKLIIIGDGLKDVYRKERKWQQLNENYSF